MDQRVFLKISTIVDQCLVLWLSATMEQSVVLRISKVLDQCVVPRNIALCKLPLKDRKFCFRDVTTVPRAFLLVLTINTRWQKLRCEETKETHNTSDEATDPKKNTHVQRAGRSIRRRLNESSQHFHVSQQIIVFRAIKRTAKQPSGGSLSDIIIAYTDTHRKIKTCRDVREMAGQSVVILPWLSDVQAGSKLRETCSFPHFDIKH
jgi:hypothetical protein